MNLLRQTNILPHHSRYSARKAIPKRFIFTENSSGTIYNVNNRLRQEEESYCNDLSTAFKPPIRNVLSSVVKETREKFSKKQIMMVNETQAKFLHQLIKLLQPKNVLEIGGFTGSSAIAMGSALPPNSHLDSLELEEEHAKLLKKYINEAGLQNVVNVIIGPADKSLVSLGSLSKKYDFVFLDADKGGYIKYFNYVLDNKMLTKNGLIVADNVLKSGLVHRAAGYEQGSGFDAPENEMEIAQQLNRFNQHVLKDPRVEVVMLPLFDGISLIRKVGEKNRK